MRHDVRRDYCATIRGEKRIGGVKKKKKKRFGKAEQRLWVNFIGRERIWGEACVDGDANLAGLPFSVLSNQRSAD